MESAQLADSHCGILMGIHLDKCKTAIGLETGLRDVAEVREERYEITLSSIRSEVAHIAGGLPLRSLLDNHIVTTSSVSREVMVTHRRCRRHSHGGHGLLLGDGWLTLLIGPVATNGARSKPFPIHGAERLLGIAALAESDESVTTRAASLHIPHHARFGNRTESGESLKEDFIVDFVAKITNEDMEMVRSILLVGVVGLIGPIDTNFLLA